MKMKYLRINIIVRSENMNKADNEQKTKVTTSMKPRNSPPSDPRFLFHSAQYTMYTQNTHKQFQLWRRKKPGFEEKIHGEGQLACIGKLLFLLI